MLRRDDLLLYSRPRVVEGDPEYVDDIVTVTRGVCRCTHRGVRNTRKWGDRIYIGIEAVCGNINPLLNVVPPNLVDFSSRRVRR